ncbi:MAG: Gldg family protein, partial [Bacteroidales bacterium]
RQIYAIAKAELRTLFFSPIAWLIIIIFSFQAYSAFAVWIESITNRQAVSGFTFDITRRIFTEFSSIYPTMQKNLFLYIPLLTMGLMSREYSSGSIKLLYSSPIGGAKMVFGKYLAIVWFALIMMATIVPTLIFTVVKVESADITFMLSGFLGLSLLLFAYSAIGLFMSTLSSYQVVVAMLTLGVLALFNNMGSIAQEVDILRDVTHWLSLPERADKFIEGIIASEDLFYFIIVIALFLSLSIVKIYSDKSSNRRETIIGRYLAVVVAASLLAYISSTPTLKFYYDASQIKANTLTERSQEILKEVKGKVEMTTYVNMADFNFFMAIPATINRDKDKFYDLKRFLPRLKMNYLYYYDEPYNNSNYVAGETSAEDLARQISGAVEIDFDHLYTPRQIREMIDLKEEDNTFVREVKLENGNRTFLRSFDDLDRYPTEAEFAATFLRLTQPIPTITFSTGFGEPSITRAGENDYSSFAAEKKNRESLLNQAFDVQVANLGEIESMALLDSTDILVVADPKRALSPQAMESTLNYLRDGGNMLIAIEPGREHHLKPLLEELGLESLPGTLVHPNQEHSPTLILSKTTHHINKMSDHFRFIFGRVITMPSAVGLDYRLGGKYIATPLTVTPSRGAWNEVESKNFVTDTISYNRLAGEVQRTIATSFSLTRQVGNREQRVVVLGDAHTISNGEFNTSRSEVRKGNSGFIKGIMHWLTYNKVPIDVTRPFPIDNKIFLTIGQMEKWRPLIVWVIPIVLSLLGATILIRRRMN